MKTIYIETKCSDELPKDDIIVFAFQLILTTTFWVVARYNEEKKYWEEYLEEHNGELKGIISWLKPVQISDEIDKVISEVEYMHPYKEAGNLDSYSEYNEGWTDACDILGERIKTKLNQ